VEGDGEFCVCPVEETASPVDDPELDQILRSEPRILTDRTRQVIQRFPVPILGSEDPCPVRQRLGEFRIKLEGVRKVRRSRIMSAAAEFEFPPEVVNHRVIGSGPDQVGEIGSGILSPSGPEKQVGPDPTSRNGVRVQFDCAVEIGQGLVHLVLADGATGSLVIGIREAGRALNRPIQARGSEGEIVTSHVDERLPVVCRTVVRTEPRGISEISGGSIEVPESEPGLAPVRVPLGLGFAGREGVGEIGLSLIKLTECQTYTTATGHPVRAARREPNGLVQIRNGRSRSEVELGLSPGGEQPGVDWIEPEGFRQIGDAALGLAKGRVSLGSASVGNGEERIQLDGPGQIAEGRLWVAGRQQGRSPIQKGNRTSRGEFGCAGEIRNRRLGLAESDQSLPAGQMRCRVFRVGGDGGAEIRDRRSVLSDGRIRLPA
jgi:hypothetical protein